MGSTPPERHCTDANNRPDGNITTGNGRKYDETVRDPRLNFFVIIGTILKSDSLSCLQAAEIVSTCGFSQDLDFRQNARQHSARSC